MAKDMICVCRAATLEEADIIVIWLGGHGIDAFVKDRNMVGMAWGTPAFAPRGIEVMLYHAGDEERALALLAQKAAESDRPDVAGAPIEAMCEECGGIAVFPYGKRGKVEDCPHCGGFLDVPDPGTVDESSESEGG